MKLDAARIVLRPRSMAELLDLALRFCSEPAAKLYAKLGALTLLPAWLLCCAAAFLLDWSWVDVWLLAVALATPIQGVFTVAVGRKMFAEEVSVGEVLLQFWRRFFPYMGALIVSRLFLGLGGLGFFTVILPIWVWARVAYVHEACLLEQASAVGSLTRAGNMIKGRAPGAAGMLLLMTLGVCAFVLSAELLINNGLLEFLLQVGTPLGSLFYSGGSAAALFGFFLAVPFWSTARFLSYIDQRTRLDGWDIQLRFMAIQAADADEHERGAA
ncbi:hypothetical protein G6O69_10755 [Pseudenhygromyxa sp. WMMC2535]|uniref:hypothetical protein n=1 Tax=Pseudenhygromyxa sp. WMMC2535 TaxID=2712867 RepID=UPI0015543E7D|nr:hypothetical protein [Pseudenhygromyxa sp. WMMC2535]NVB38312.1 hypothetical protein [Pseudenhygromyxa sp. WMMC2535]